MYDKHAVTRSDVLRNLKLRIRAVLGDVRKLLLRQLSSSAQIRMQSESKTESVDLISKHPSAPTMANCISAAATKLPAAPPLSPPPSGPPPANDWSRCKFVDASGTQYEYEGEVENGKPNGMGRAIYPSGSIYEGNFADGLAKGWGMMTFSSGSVYEGTWANDKYNGKGTYTSANGDIYEGEYKDNKRHGYGIRTRSDGSVVHDGMWERGAPVRMKDKEQVYKFTDPYGKQYEYVGDIQNGKPHGTGRAHYTNSGNTYEGNWVKGLGHGIGTMIFARKGSKYEGEWRNDRYNGRGKFTYRNGDIFEGQFKDNKRIGRGTYTWANGAVYVGEFKNKTRHGQGKHTNPDGSVLHDVMWNNGVPVVAMEVSVRTSISLTSSKKNKNWFKRLFTSK